MALSRKDGIFVIVITGYLILNSIVVLIVLHPIFDLKLQFTLANDTLLFKIWKDLPLHLKLYFFNVTNYKNFIRYGIPIEVKEVGPYTYKIKRIKEITGWKSGIVSYREKKTFYFDHKNSVGSEDDYILSLNGPLIFAGSFIENKMPWQQKRADTIFTLFNEKLVTKRTIRQLAFGGYNDSFLNYGNFFQKFPFHDGTFSWLYKKNSTDEGQFTVNTGEYNTSELNMVNSWNESSKLSFWEKNSECSDIKGTNAEIGPPIRDNRNYYTFFQPIFCRSITFDYFEIIKHFKTETRRFKNTAKIFANKIENPENYCFDNNNHTIPSLPSGILNISSCQFDAPILISFPHFYLADKSLLKNVNGLRPNATMHESFIDVDPITGVSYALAIRFQINVFLHKNEYYREFQNISSGVYPVLWMEMSSEIDKNVATMLYNTFVLAKLVVNTIFEILIATFLVFFFVGFLVLIFTEGDTSLDEIQPLLRPNDINNDFVTDNQPCSLHRFYGSVTSDDNFTMQ